MRRQGASYCDLRLASRAGDLHSGGGRAYSVPWGAGGTILCGATQGGDTGSCCLNNILIGSYFRRVVCEKGCRLGTGRVEVAELTRAVKPVRDTGAAAEHAP